MLAANEAVAEAIRDRGLHFLRRVHQSPSPQKLDALTEFVTELGYKTGSLQSRFALQKLLDASTGKPEQHAVHFAVLRSLQRAIYSPMEEGHYALASECYCHFTSPIRRYPDLTIHRLVDAMLTKSRRSTPADARVDLRRAGRARPALLRPRAAGRGRRTRFDQAQAAGLPQHPHRRGNGSRRDRRRELRAVRPRRETAGRRAGARRNAPRRPLLLRSRLAHAWPAIAPATAIASAICCAWPSPASIWNAARSTSAWWRRRKAGRRYPRRAQRARRKIRNAPREDGTQKSENESC